MDRGAWWATVHRVAKRQTPPKRLSTQTGTERREGRRGDRSGVRVHGRWEMVDSESNEVW